MFRFTIRDLLWLTVVVALGMGWWVVRSQLIRRERAAKRESERSALVMDWLMKDFDVIKPGWRGAMWSKHPDWDGSIQEIKKRQAVSKISK